MKSMLVLALFTVGLCLPAVSAAGTLGPKKASDLRTVIGVASGTLCPGLSSFRSVDAQQNPDGTTGLFSIPAGEVFIVTSLDVQAGNSAGATAEVDLFVSDGAGGASFVARCGGIAGSNGFAVATCAIPPGVAVKSGSTLCLAGTPTVTVHGFMAKDK